MDETRLFKDSRKQRRNAADLEMSERVLYHSHPAPPQVMSGLSSCAHRVPLVTELMVHILQMFYCGALKGKEGKLLMSDVFLDLRTQDIICVSVFHPEQGGR